MSKYSRSALGGMMILSLFLLSPVCNARIATGLTVPASLTGVFHDVQRQLQAQLSSPVVYPLSFATQTAPADSPVAQVCQAAQMRLPIQAVETLRDSRYQLHQVVCNLCYGGALGKSNFLAGNPPCADRIIVEPNLRTDVETKLGGDSDNNCAADRIAQQTLCLPQGFDVFAWNVQVNSVSSQSQILSEEKTPGSPECVVVRYRLKGGGYQRILGVKNCQEHAWIKFEVTLLGSAGAAKP